MRLRENVTRAIIPVRAGPTLPLPPLFFFFFCLLLSQMTGRSQHPSDQEPVFNFSDFSKAQRSSIQAPSRKKTSLLQPKSLLLSLSFCSQSKLSFKTAGQKAKSQKKAEIFTSIRCLLLVILLLKSHPSRWIFGI